MNNEELRLYAKQYREEHPKEIQEHKRRYYLRHREAINKYMREYRKVNPDKVRAIMAKSNAKCLRNRRQKAIDLLGGKCAMCGYDKDPRAFQIDHVNGGGKAEREAFNSPAAYYNHIFATGGEGYQLLCANCNQIKEIERREYLKQVIE